ncbi:putative tail fiber protein [Klebsiella phage vB_KqM-Westerburg]|nr:putative tail fiber protein [Klebsiella phage vB_KqM-Westerburg]
MGYFQMARNIEEIFGGVVVAPHQIPFTYTSTNGGETFLSLPFYPITGFVTINGGVQVPLDNFEINGNTLYLGRELEPSDVVFCLFDKIMSPQDASNNAIRIYKFLSVGGETEFTPDFTAYGVQSLYIDGKYKTPGEDYNYFKTSNKVVLDNGLAAGVWVVAEMNIKQNIPALAGNDGASQIGTLSGKTVQEEINEIPTEINDAVDGIYQSLQLHQLPESGAMKIGLTTGETVEEAIASLKRRTMSIMPEDFVNLSTDTEKLLAAVAYAKANNIETVLLMPGKTYTFTGTQGLDIDLGYFSFVCPFGRSYIDFSNFTGPYCLWAHSSQSYPYGARNHCHTMKGVHAKAAIQGINQALLLLGNNNNSSNGTYNGDCKIESCLFSTADIVVMGSASTWRYKFLECGFMMETAGTYAMYFPAGISDSGESITFQNCKIFDMKRCPILLACNNFAIGMPGTSVLNTPIQITGAGAMIVLDSAANIENPGATTWYRYAEVTGVAARLILNGATLVCNGPSNQTKPLFYVGTNAFIDFSHVKTPGNAYQFYSGDEGYNTFVEGPGFVIANSCIADIASGAGNIPLHKSLNPIRNYAFASGDTTSWSFNNQGSPSQTVVVAPEYGFSGYGARMTSFGSLSCYLTQNAKVTNNNYFTTTIKLRTVQAGTSSVGAGALSINFYDRNGVSVQASSIATISNTVGSWVSIGNFIQGRVPQSAEYAEVSIRCREGAIIDVDSVIINFS